MPHQEERAITDLSGAELRTIDRALQSACALLTQLGDPIDCFPDEQPQHGVTQDNSLETETYLGG